MLMMDKMNTDLNENICFEHKDHEKGEHKKAIMYTILCITSARASRGCKYVTCVHVSRNNNNENGKKCLFMQIIPCMALSYSNFHYISTFIYMLKSNYI